jgi:hypothetical protein
MSETVNFSVVTPLLWVGSDTHSLLHALRLIKAGVYALHYLAAQPQATFHGWRSMS